MTETGSCHRDGKASRGTQQTGKWIEKSSLENHIMGQGQVNPSSDPSTNPEKQTIYCISALGQQIVSFVASSKKEKEKKRSKRRKERGVREGRRKGRKVDC